MTVAYVKEKISNGKNELDDGELAKLIKISNNNIVFATICFVVLSLVLFITVSTGMLLDFSKGARPLSKEPSKDPAIMASFVGISNASAGLISISDLKSSYDQLLTKIEQIDGIYEDAELYKILSGDRRIPYARSAANSVVSTSFGSKAIVQDRAQRRVAFVQIMTPSIKSLDYTVQISGEVVDEVDLGEFDATKPFDFQSMQKYAKYDNVSPKIKSHISDVMQRIAKIDSELTSSISRESSLIDAYFARSQVDVFGYYITVFGRMVLVAVLVSSIGVCIKIMIAELSSVKTLKQIYYASRLAREIPSEDGRMEHVRSLMGMMAEEKYVRYKPVDMQGLLEAIAEKLKDDPSPGPVSRNSGGPSQAAAGRKAKGQKMADGQGAAMPNPGE